MSGIDALRDWAASGAMALTGRAGGPPVASPGAPASYVRQMLTSVARDGEKLAGRALRLPGVELPGVELLGERAAYAGLSRRGPWSCGGAFRAVPTLDGWFGVSLPRPEDAELVPALTGTPTADPWAAVATWAAGVTTKAAVERAALLGLAHAGSGEETADVDLRFLGRRTVTRNPLVVDLSSLWAGPLCANLLTAAGARVVKVESPRRPDGARRGSPRFFDMLHAGSDVVALDLQDPADVVELRGLIARADLVIEASRPRALAQAGVVAADCVTAGTSWLSITARGRASNTIGFGDDVAAAAGLVVADRDEILPCGDALADPLTGVAAARHALSALLSEEACLIDLPMLAVARAARALAPDPPDHRVEQRGEQWWVDAGSSSFRVEPPRARC